MKKAIFTLLCLLPAFTCQARTIIVDANGSGEYPTIQDAIDDSNNGDIVILTPGTYTGQGNRDIDFNGLAITLRSTDPNDPNVVAATIIDCNGTEAEPHRGFYFHSGEDANSAVDGFTITNGYATWQGGGIYCQNSSPTITNCTIADNSAEYKGGGIYCYRSSPTITNCTFSGNSAELGGGIACYNSSPTIINCVISGNLADAGGGIYCWDSSPTITNCTITGNSAKYNGGGIYCYNSSPVITNCILWDGGNEIWNNDNSTINITYSNIQDGWPGIGNINTDPNFAFSTDYHLMPNSHCIDTGTNTPTAGLPATDINGNPRPLDGNGDGTAIADMGAYEYNPNSPPIIAVSSSAFNFSYIQDLPKPAPQTLFIRNCGGRTLNWQTVEDCNWLQVTPTSGTLTDQIGEITLTVDPNNMALGHYNCSFTVSDPNAVNSPVTIQVLLHVITILRVPEQFNTIQSAIDAAVDYDIVLVADGTYTGDGNRDLDFYGKAITVRSTDPNDPNIVAATIIDCQGSISDPHRGFYFHSREDENSVLSGFTIKNGSVEGGGGWGPIGGGGILCYSSSPTISNCIITDNTTYSQTVTGQSYGGGIYLDGSNATITNCTISNNRASYGGGGIYCLYSSPTISNCTINDNITDFYDGGAGAGGIYCSRSSPTISNCTISGNKTNYRGGGICFIFSTPTITNCMFIGNLAVEAEASGGMIWNSGSSLMITNCTFAENYAANGNAIACDSSEQQHPSNLQLTNCILWDGGNEIYNNDGSTIDITYSDIQNGWPGTGNIDVDPCFVSPGCWADANDPNIIVEPNDPNAVWIEGDYHLYPFSLCINAGDPNYLPEPNETDLDGNPRIIAGRIDMGAYESNHTRARLWIFPRLIYRYNGRQRRVLAWLRLPKGVTEDQIDSNTPLLLYPGEIEPTRQYIFQRGRRIKRTSIIAYFDKRDLMDVISNNGRVELKLVGRLKIGRYFYGTDTVRIINRRPPLRRPLHSR